MAGHVQSYKRMRGDSEWESVQRKLKCTETGWQHVRVIPLLVTVDQEAHGSQAIVDTMGDLSAQIPADPGCDVEAQVAVGTLDINIARSIPSEYLIGTQPLEHPESRRAYLSNVCVAHAARRKVQPRHMEIACR